MGVAVSNLEIKMATRVNQKLLFLVLFWINLG